MITVILGLLAKAALPAAGGALAYLLTQLARRIGIGNANDAGESAHKLIRRIVDQVVTSLEQEVRRKIKGQLTDAQARHLHTTARDRVLRLLDRQLDTLAKRLRIPRDRIEDFIDDAVEAAVFALKK